MDGHEIASRSNRIAAFILYVAIAAAPLPFGSRDDITIAFWCFLLGLGLLLASPSQLRRGHYLLLGGIGFIVACYGFVLHEQLADHPWIASPNPIWAKASELLGRHIQPSVSIIRGEPFYAMGAPLANVLALILGLVVGADQKIANRALAVMAWAGAGYAVYGIGDLLLDPTAWLWREKLYNIDSVTATFINRNTAAAYLGSCAVVWLVTLMQSVRLRLPSGPIKWRKLPEQIASKASGEARIITHFGMFFLCLAAMFMTGSRGGVLLSLFAMVIAFVIFFRRDLPRATSLVLALVGAAIVALVLLQFLGGNVQMRIDEGGLVEQGRLAAYRSTLRMIADHPWFGTGLGTFKAAIPAYRSGDISIVGVWNAAHSTPLELAAEIGVPLAAIIAFGWIVAFVVLFRGTSRSRRETVLPLSALAVTLIAVLHTSIDFSMQVAGYAIVVFGLVGVGLSQSFEAVSPLRKQRQRSIHRSVQAAPAEDATVRSKTATST